MNSSKTNLYNCGSEYTPHPLAEDKAGVPSPLASGGTLVVPNSAVAINIVSESPVGFQLSKDTVGVSGIVTLPAGVNKISIAGLQDKTEYPNEIILTGSGISFWFDCITYNGR